MANRYWVGGAGTWNTSSTTNWSTSSGGASGASVPTSADSVFFDQAGTYTVTMTGSTAAPLNCLDWTVSAGTVTFSGNLSATNAFNVYGSITMVSGTVPNTSAVWLAATSSKTLTYSGTFTSTLTLNMVGTGGSWTLGAALTASNSTIVLTDGSFSTSASNYNVTVSAITVSANSNTKVMSLNGSTVTCGTFTNSSTGGFTFNAGTSTYVGGTNPQRITSGGITFNVVRMGSATTVFQDDLSCASLDTIPTTGGSYIILGGNITVSGLLTTGTTTYSTTPYRRMFYKSSIPGTARTITAGSFSVFYTDFEDITKSGAALTGTSVGSCGGNTNITATAAKTVYLSASASSAVAATTGNLWSTSSGGATATANFPLPQDTAVIDDNSCTSGGTITFDTYAVNIGTLTISGRTNPMTLGCTGSAVVAAAQSTRIYSSMSFPSNMPLTGTFGFAGRGTQTLTIGSSTSTASLLLNGAGTVLLGGNITTTGSIYFCSGTLDLNSYVLSVDSLTIATLYYTIYPTRAFTFNGGSIELTGSGAIWTPTNNLGTVTVTGTPNVYVKYAGATAVNVGGTGAITPEASSFNFFFQAGTYSLTPPIGGRNIDFTGFSGTCAGAAFYLYGNLTFSTGMTVTTSSIIFVGTSGTQTITSNGKSTSGTYQFSGVGGNYVLADALTSTSTNSGVILSNGTLDLNGKTLTCANAQFITNTGTKNLTFNGGTLVCGAALPKYAFRNFVPAGFTTTAGTGTGKISVTAATAKTFSGGGATFNCTLSNDGAGALTVTDDNTFTTIANGVQPTAFTFTAASTQTVTNWNVSGTAGNLVTITSGTAGVPALLSKASGIVSSDYLSLQDSTALGGAAWYAGANSTNVSGNLGWVFTAPGTGNFFFMF